MAVCFLACVALFVLRFAPPVLADLPYHTDLEAYQHGDLGEEPFQTFRSSPLQAPIYQINHFDAALVDASSEQARFLFMAGRYGGLWGPSIVLSRDLSLVWADQRFTNVEGMSQAAHSGMLRGEPVLVVYCGDAVHIYNQQYEETYVVRGHGDLEGVVVDSHEAGLTDSDTVLLFACPAVEADLTTVGGPASGRLVANCIAQEVDPVTNEVLFQFSTLDYFRVEDSVWEYIEEDEWWDFCHMNSIQKTPDGNFLLSYRHLSAVVLVDGKTRKVIWVMGGKRNMFTDVGISSGPSATFRYQHEPRITSNHSFTLFDNHRLDNGFCLQNDVPCSRALELAYDPVSLTVWVLHEWTHPQRVVSASRGGVQRTPGDKNNTLVAWGQNPLFTEYSPEGDLVMDFQRGQVLAIEHGLEGIVAYRASKGAWVGKPSWGPSIAVETTNETATTFFVSWNGATEVDRYLLLTANTTDDLHRAASNTIIAQSPRTGFETEFVVLRSQISTYGRIVALDIHGTVLGATPAIHADTGEQTDLDSPKLVSASVTVPSTILSSPSVTVPMGTQMLKTPVARNGANATSSHAAVPVTTDVSHASQNSTLSVGAASAIAACATSLVWVVLVCAAYLVLRRRRRQTRRDTVPFEDKGRYEAVKDAETAGGLLPNDVELEASFQLESDDEDDDDEDEDGGGSNTSSDEHEADSKEALLPH